MIWGSSPHIGRRRGRTPRCRESRAASPAGRRTWPAAARAGTGSRVLDPPEEETVEEAELFGREQDGFRVKKRKREVAAAGIGGGGAGGGGGEGPGTATTAPQAKKRQAGKAQPSAPPPQMIDPWGRPLPGTAASGPGSKPSTTLGGSKAAASSGTTGRGSALVAAATAAAAKNKPAGKQPVAPQPRPQARQSAARARAAGASGSNDVIVLSDSE